MQNDESGANSQGASGFHSSFIIHHSSFDDQREEDLMDVIMPQLGETVAEGVVTKWHKAVGDDVKADETLFDVETDKVSTEIPAPASGVITEIVVQEGGTAKVGARLAVIREAGAAKAASPVRASAQASQPAPATAARAASAARHASERGVRD